MFSSCFTAFLFGAHFDEHRLVEGFVDENALVEGFVDEIMVFGDYMSKYSSDGDEK